MTTNLDWAMNTSYKFNSTLQVIHSIDTKKVTPQGYLRIIPDGEANYSDDKNNVTLGIKGVYDIFGKWINNEAELYSAINYVRIHECCHLYYTGGKSWKWAINSGTNIVLEYIAKQENYLPNKFKREADAKNFEAYLTDKYGSTIVDLIMHLVHFVANSLEDGRIERIQAAKEPGFAKTRLFYRGTCFWNSSENTFPEYEQIQDNPIIKLQIILSQVLNLATCQVYQKGFVKMYGDTPLMETVRSIMPYIAEGYLAKSTRAMAIATQKICTALAPLIYESAKQQSQNNEVAKQMMEALINKLIEAIKQSLGDSDDFGDSDQNAQEDDTDSTNSAMPFSDLEITVDKETFDKLREKADKNNQPGSGITIKCEDASMDDDTQDDSNQSSNNDSSQNNNESESEQMKAKPSKSSSDSSQNDEHHENQQDVKSDQSDNKAELGKSSRVSSSGGTYDEQTILDEMQKAADAMIAEAEETVENINIMNRTEVTHAKQIGETIDTSKPISSHEMSDICDFKEFHRAYKVDRKLPADLLARGKKLHKDIEHYFKTLMTPCAKNKRNGVLDKKAITRLAKNKTNVFMKKGHSKNIDGCVYILLDNSGSMYGMKRKEACKAAAVIEEGFKGLMPMKIVAFDECGAIIHEVIKNWDESLNNNCCWNFCLQGRNGSGNEDDNDIRVATRELLARPESKKMLIILSDGAPSDTTNVKSAVQMARSKGIKVSSIYFEEGTPDNYAISDFAYMYEKDYICCPVKEIEQHLSKILQKFAHSK